MKVDVINRGAHLPDEDLRRDAISIFQALILLTDLYTGTKMSTTSMVTSSALDELASSRLNFSSGFIVQPANLQSTDQEQVRLSVQFNAVVSMKCHVTRLDGRRVYGSLYVKTSSITPRRL